SGCCGCGWLRYWLGGGCGLTVGTRRRRRHRPASMRRKVNHQPTDGQADHSETEKCRRHAPIALDRLMILNLRRRRMSGGNGVVRKLPHEFVEGRFGIEADFEGVRTDDAAAEDAAGQTRDVVAFERLERGDGNLSGVGNLAQRQTAALARFAQLAPDIACALLCTHAEDDAPPPMLNPARRARTTSFIGRSASPKSPRTAIP